jgi:hypothetical protein
MGFPTDRPAPGSPGLTAGTEQHSLIILGIYVGSDSVQERCARDKRVED